VLKRAGLIHCPPRKILFSIQQTSDNRLQQRTKTCIYKLMHHSDKFSQYFHINFSSAEYSLEISATVCAWCVSFEQSCESCADDRRWNLAYVSSACAVQQVPPTVLVRQASTGRYRWTGRNCVSADSRRSKSTNHWNCFI